MVEGPEIELPFDEIKEKKTRGQTPKFQQRFPQHFADKRFTMGVFHKTMNNFEIDQKYSSFYSVKGSTDLKGKGEIVMPRIQILQG